MDRFTSAMAAGVLLLGAAVVAPAAASAQTRVCPVSQSFFGTLKSVQGNTIVLQTDEGRMGTVSINSGAQFNAHGYALRPGVYVGVFGCATPNGVFHASQVNLAANAARYHQSLSGVIARKASDRLYVAEPVSRMTRLWMVPDADEFRVGQSVTGVGMLGAQGVFYPQRINNASTAFVPERETTAPRSITLAGTIKRIAPGRLYVWEPAYRTTGTWFVKNWREFRVGQRVVGTGTENTKGDFFPFSVRR
jgi:hypothetical protein